MQVILIGKLNQFEYTTASNEFQADTARQSMLYNIVENQYSLALERRCPMRKHDRLWRLLLLMRLPPFFSLAAGQRRPRAQALKRLEDSARTLKDYENLVAWYDRLDANRQRKERYHELYRRQTALRKHISALATKASLPNSLPLQDTAGGSGPAV